MERNEDFAKRVRRLRAENPQNVHDSAPVGETMDDWNNFPNYFKFGSFANTSVPDTESKSPVK